MVTVEAEFSGERRGGFVPSTFFILPDPGSVQSRRQDSEHRSTLIASLLLAHATSPLLLIRPKAHVLTRGHLPSIAMSVEQFLGKKYKLSNSENFDDFMKALGVGMVTRKMGSTVSPVVELTENGGVYTLKTTSTFKNSEIKFKLGEEFDEETPDGRKVKSVCTLEGNKLMQVQKGDKETTIEREFTPTELKAIMKVDDIVCTRTYKVQE